MPCLWLLQETKKAKQVLLSAAPAATPFRGLLQMRGVMLSLIVWAGHLLRWSFSASQTTSTFLASEIYYAKHACWKECVSLWLGWKGSDSVAVLNSSLLRWFDSGRGLVESIWSTSVKVDTISFGKWAGPYAGNPRIFDLVGSIMCPHLQELSEALWNCIRPSCCFLHGKGILPVWHGPKTACIHAL